MSFPQKLGEELKALALASLYFGMWLGVLVVLKQLVLADYQIKFRGFSVALIGTLVIAKVVLILEHVPLGSWVRNRPAVIDVLLRGALYGVGVAVMMLVEKAFEARHEYGGFGGALLGVFHHRDIYHVWADTIALTCALLGFNTLSVLRLHLGNRELARLFFSSSMANLEAKQPETGAVSPAEKPDKKSLS
jgi:hypothetical protein